MEKWKSGRFEEIDVLRGLAALAVVVFHYSGYCVKKFGDFPFVFSFGARGVELFFMVSGFVIFFTLERSRSLSDFAFSRFSRLYPVYWGTLTLVVIADTLVFGNKMWWGGYIVNMTMLQKFVGFPDIDTVFWSLAVELAFYSVMGLVFAAGLMGRIVPVSLVWLGLAAAWALAAPSVGGFWPDILKTYLILPHVPYFIAGIMFYLIHAHGGAVDRVAVIICCLVTVWLKDGLEMALICMVLFATFWATLSGKLRFLVSPVTLWLGAISYPLYLVHRGLGYNVIQSLHDAGFETSTAFMLTLAGMLGLASLLSYGLERPAMRFLRQRRMAAAHG